MNVKKKKLFLKWGNLYIEFNYFKRTACIIFEKIDSNINGHANMEGEKLNSWGHTLDRELQAT